MPEHGIHREIGRLSGGLVIRLFDVIQRLIGGGNSVKL